MPGRMYSGGRLLLGGLPFSLREIRVIESQPHSQYRVRLTVGLTDQEMYARKYGDAGGSLREILERAAEVKIHWEDGKGWFLPSREYKVQRDVATMFTWVEMEGILKWDWSPKQWVVTNSSSSSHGYYETYNHYHQNSWYTDAPAPKKPKKTKEEENLSWLKSRVNKTVALAGV